MSNLVPEVITELLIRIVRGLRAKFAAQYPDMQVEFVQMPERKCSKCDRLCVHVKVTASKMESLNLDICPKCLACYKSPWHPPVT